MTVCGEPLITGSPGSLERVTLAFSDDQVDAAVDFEIENRAIDRARTIRYTAVFEAAGLQPPQELHLGGDSDLVTAFMKAFHDRCVARRLPPLDSLVVHVAGGREGRPGSGYFRVNGYVDPFAERSNASAEAVLAAHAFWESFGSTARRTRGAMFQLTYRSRPFYPAPLPDIDEERLVRERKCAGCGLRYAVFGEHRFCPVCGSLPPLTVALDAIEAESTRLDALMDLPNGVLATLRETGVLQRTYVDTIENLVGAIEVLADGIFRSRVPTADAALRGKGKVFQRLDDLADLFALHLAIDVRSAGGLDWSSLLLAWATRHVFTHCDGIIDAKYLAAVPTSPYRVGQRLQISETDARAAIENTKTLCGALVPPSE